MHNDQRPTRFWAAESRQQLHSAVVSAFECHSEFFGAAGRAEKRRKVPNSAWKRLKLHYAVAGA
eukprot:2143475-Alexandrium_andersonii.AAC.1